MLAWFSPEETTAIALSVKVAVVAALASLPVGVAVAWLLARKRFPGKALLDALVHLPLVLPPVVVGYALLVWLGHNGALGRFLPLGQAREQRRGEPQLPGIGSSLRSRPVNRRHSWRRA